LRTPIILAWVDSYDIAVIVTSDSNFVPVASFLQTKGKKVVHGQLRPKGALLSKKCWGSIDVTKMREKFRMVQLGKGKNVRGVRDYEREARK
jgi:uncharacterized LabA/DUF88 family protein